MFASCLPRNQENQPPKTDHSSPQQCELSRIGSNNCIFEHLKHRLNESSAWLGTERLLFIPQSKKNEFLDTWRNDAFRMYILEIPQSEWQKCFDNWFKRVQKCIDLWKTVKRFSMINHCFCSLTRKYKRQHLYLPSEFLPEICWAEITDEILFVFCFDVYDLLLLWFTT